ncbi:MULTISPECIES: DUF3048 domain-containing protein [Anoxybacillus]|uniref:DUF3048 domain-containing protein n=1 Tax=Anoxybacillus flavithermus TaxID=33934 RepID=A0AAX2A1H0_9BACL|nr:DUF3048 domain-containing protein [Anoxybacillus flavithermus]ASA97390.1 DUF3048 domain-containing protein [Anoxybacillus flavithermus]ELK23077.1 extracellular solute-binding lipoprotein, TRAP-type [Anoxybacillus flavithermus TNO-09.006]MBE2905424.1 DUF3048 domain-containing protein [Anoxybacillus flavithermus]MBE2918989.1 DUF3048 domain-containing protein [Anoxybacillus flavithermus]MBE2924545.1 DUF3048 domain-containing protein [Anoxybacillus flavithermus]
MLRRLLFLLLITLAVMFGVGCQRAEQNMKEKGSPPTTIEQGNEQGKEEAMWTFPLTGMPASEKTMQRVVAVMVNNYPTARPQSGLHKADIVYEALAEGDITRLLAIYQSEQPDVIGPVRSARDYFIQLSNGFHALYVCHGWSPEAQRLLRSGSVDHVNGLFYDGTLFWRDRTRKAPHNSYISFEHIKKGAEKNGYAFEEEVKPLPFFSNDLTRAVEATNIDVVYSKRSYAHVHYTYDGTKYVRSSGGKPTVDRETNTPIAVENVFVVEATHRIIDDYGRRDIDFTSGGKGYLFQKGTVQEVEWKNVEGRLLPYKSGAPLGFVPGKTWIQVVPNLKQVQYE